MLCRFPSGTPDVGQSEGLFKGEIERRIQPTRAGAYDTEVHLS